MVRRIAVYGTYHAKVPVRQRFWKSRRDGAKQRYWKKTTRTKKALMSGRYEFSGSGKALYKAVVKALHIVPRGFVQVSAEDFLRNPLKYGFEGVWIEREVES